MSIFYKKRRTTEGLSRHEVSNIVQNVEGIEHLADVTDDVQAQLDAKLQDGDTINGVSPTEMGQLSGVNAPIQAQMLTKYGIYSDPTFGTVTATGNVNGVNPLEMAYLSGITSGGQSQLNSKLKDGDTINGVSPTEMGYLSGMNTNIKAKLISKLEQGDTINGADPTEMSYLSGECDSDTTG